jgi:hypothetical protein
MNQELVRAFKKNNKERRAIIAKKYGYSSVEEYIAFLEGVIAGNGSISTPKLGLAYVVDISDASGSMSGGKYDNTKKGITLGISDLKPRKDVRYSLVEFVELNLVRKPLIGVIPSNINQYSIPFYGANGGNTPLYKTVYDTLVELKERVGENDTVLVKIYTDKLNCPLLSEN